MLGAHAGSMKGVLVDRSTRRSLSSLDLHVHSAFKNAIRLEEGRMPFCLLFTVLCRLWVRLYTKLLSSCQHGLQRQAVAAADNYSFRACQSCYSTPFDAVVLQECPAANSVPLAGSAHVPLGSPHHGHHDGHKSLNMALLPDDNSEPSSSSPTRATWGATVATLLSLQLGWGLWLMPHDFARSVCPPSTNGGYLCTRPHIHFARPFLQKSFISAV